MNHGYFQDRLSAYFDQALTLEEMQMMKEHLASCAECREQLDDLAKLDRLIEAKADLGESDYWEKAAQTIERRLTTGNESKVTKVRSGWFGLGWKLVATAASIAALTFIALHEGEIQDSVDKSGEVSKFMMAPSPAADSELGNEVEFDMDEITDDMGLALESAGEPAGPKGKSSGMKKAPSPALVPTESDVAKELEGKAAAEEVWQKVDRKRQASEEEIDTHSVPVTSVDELLESVAGVVTSADGEIFIRGGRAGEVAYIVDGVPIEDTSAKEVVVDLGTIALERKRTDIGKTITVQGQRDIIDKFEVSNQAAITREQIRAQPVTSVEELLEHPLGVIILDSSEISRRSTGVWEAWPNLSLINPTDSHQIMAWWWRAVRDSLQPLIIPPLQVSYSFAQKSIGASDKKDGDLSLDSPPPPPLSDSIQSPTPLERYLEACYKVAELTDRESEYDSALVIIEKYARDQNSRVQDLARHYLELIDALQE